MSDELHIPKWEDIARPISSLLRPLTDEERKAEEFTPEEAAALRARLDDIGRCDLGPRGRGWLSYHLEGWSR